MHDFWAMGGYGAYVWSSYGLTIVILLANIVAPYRRLRRVLHQIDSTTADEERR